MSDDSRRPVATAPASTAAPACHELLHQARIEAGGWDALAALVPVNPRTRRRRPSLSRLKQMGTLAGVSRISDPDTLEGLVAACADLPSAEAGAYTLDAWVASQRETLRRRGLEVPAAAAPSPVAMLPAARRRTALERAVQETLAATDTTGLTHDQVDAVVGLITHFAAGTRHRRGA